MTSVAADPGVLVDPAGRSSGPFDRRLTAIPGVRVTVAASVGIGIGATATVVVQAVALGHLLASAMPGARPTDRTGDFIAIGTALGVRSLLALASELVARKGAVTAKAALRARLVTSLVARSPANRRRAPSDVAMLAGRGLDALDPYLARCLPDLVLGVVAPVVLLLAVGILDWLSALVLAVAVCLFPVFGALVGRATGGLARDRWRQVAVLARRVADAFEGMPVLRAFGRTQHARESIASADEALRRASMASLRVAFVSALVLDTLASVSVALVAVPLGLRLLGGGVPLAAALAVLVVAPEVLLPLRRASAEFHESAEGLAAVAQAFGLMAGEGGDVRDIGAPAPMPGRGYGPVPDGPVPDGPVPDPAMVPIRLTSVDVELPGREATPVLAGATLTIDPGERVALVGPNGIGKSTVTALLLGFLAPSAGTVCVGGQDLGHVDLDGWRRRITYLSATPAIVAGTLADNLRLGRRDATDEELRRALAAAGAPLLVGALEQGLATRIGTGGRPLSAGERQRVALARVLLRPASLFVLDEPTVHLDEHAEALALASLDRAIGGASALLVTHRLEVLALADRVLTIAGGRFVEVRTWGERGIAVPEIVGVPA